jgi:hypothetical protein
MDHTLAIAGYLVLLTLLAPFPDIILLAENYVYQYQRGVKCAPIYHHKTFMGYDRRTVKGVQTLQISKIILCIPNCFEETSSRQVNDFLFITQDTGIDANRQPSLRLQMLSFLL